MAITLSSRQPDQRACRYANAFVCIGAKLLSPDFEPDPDGFADPAAARPQAHYGSSWEFALLHDLIEFVEITDFDIVRDFDLVAHEVHFGSQARNRQRQRRKQASGNKRVTPTVYRSPHPPHIKTRTLVSL
ncbi:MAG: hypothetical protein GY789_26505 [Hyphomicrobiales bacterium]|nr:hypothetical protein [Hyphomicrobiales bacterium]